MTNISEQMANSAAANAKSAKAAAVAAADSAKPAAMSPETAAKVETKTTLAHDIRGKWDKFSEIEVGALNSDDDLINQVAAKYAVSVDQAKSDVTTLLAGRTI